jgi:hypothetical protein
LAIAARACTSLSGAPSSNICAHWYVIRRAATQSAAESTSGKLTPWKSMIGWPNCRRSVAHAVVSSSSRRMAPTQRAAMWMRSSMNHAFCCSPPWPTASGPPSTAVSGTSQSNAMVGWPSG